jgi:hypothetical protein
MKHPEKLLVYCLALILLVFPFFLHDTHYSLTPQEFYFYNQGQNLSFTYIENAPLLAWLAYVSYLLGGSFFAVKLIPALFGALAYVFAGKMSINLGGKVYTVFLLFLAFLFSVLLQTNFSFTPKVLEVFAYCLLCFSLVQINIAQKTWGYYTFSFAIIFGLYSSFNFLISVVAILIFAAISMYKTLLSNKHFYIGLALTFAATAPLFQTYSNNGIDIASLITNTSDTFKEEKFITQNILFYLGGTFIWLMGILYIVCLRKMHQYLVYVLAFIAIIWYTLITKQAAQNVLHIYIPLLVFGACNYERLTTRYIRFMRYVFITPLFYVGFLTIPTMVPMLPPNQLVDLVKNRKQVSLDTATAPSSLENKMPLHYANMYGYQEVMDRIATFYNSLNEEDKPKTLLLCKTKELAAALNYFKKDYNLPTAYSFDGTAAKWIPENFTIKNIILVDKQVPNDQEELFKHFETKYTADNYINDYSSLSGIKIMAFLKATTNLVYVYDSIRNNYKMN